MIDYYKTNAIYQNLLKTDNDFQWVSKNSWILVYGNKNKQESKVIVLVHGNSWIINEKITNTLQYLADKSSIPFFRVSFNDTDDSVINDVEFYKELNAEKELLSLTELKGKFSSVGLDIVDGNCDKYLNDKTSSAYHKWQRESLGNKIIVSDIDLIRINKKTYKPNEIIELKRSTAALHIWKPFSDDFINFNLIKSIADKAEIPFNIIYNQMKKDIKTKYISEDICDNLSIFSYQNNETKAISKNYSFNNFMKGDYLNEKKDTHNKLDISYPSLFEYQDCMFTCNEQFLIYCKAKKCDNKVLANNVLSLNSTPIIKNFINGVINDEQIINNEKTLNEWNEFLISLKVLDKSINISVDEEWKNKVNLFGYKLKFAQNEGFKNILINTDKSIIDEITLKNKFSVNILNILKLAYINKIKPINKDLPPIEVQNFYHIGKVIPEDGEYMGRYNKNFNLPASIFANPFPVYKPEERGSSIGKYTEWLWKQIADENITKNDLLSLRGKKLICYCSPLACHAFVVKETVELLMNNEHEFDRRVQQIRTTKIKIKP